MDSDDETCVGVDELTANAKCIILSLALAAGYWFLPRRNKWVLLAILYATYLALAWYDHIYACERTFGPTYLRSFYSWAKPSDSPQNEAYRNLCAEADRRIRAVDIAVLAALAMGAPAFFKWKPATRA